MLMSSRFRVLAGVWEQKDSLLEMSFHVPTTNTHYVGTEGRPAAQVRCW